MRKVVRYQWGNLKTQFEVQNTMTKRKLIRKQRIVKKKKKKKNTSKKTKELNNSGINLDAPEVYAPPLIPVMLFSSQIQ